MSASDSGATGAFQALFNAKVLGNLKVGHTIVTLILLPIAAFFAGLADLITASYNVLIIPLANFATGVGNLTFQIFASLGIVLEAAGLAQAESFRQGVLALFSPFALPFGVAIILASLGLVAFYLQIEETSDLIPGAVTDFFGLGAEEEA